MNIDLEDLLRQLRRATNVAKECATLLRKDNVLYKRISKRSKRWIDRQYKLDMQRLDANNEAISLASKKKKALSKLTKSERKLLGLGDLDEG